MTTHIKLRKLQYIISGTEKMAVAFSGGVDSTFLLAVAADVLGSNAIAITVHSPFIPEAEIKEAVTFCKEHSIEHIIADIDTLSIEGVEDNPKDRCYICKKALFSKMLEIAHSKGSYILAEGSNIDDLSDFRPGLRALSELRILSPLKEVGLSKEEIRLLSKEMNLPTSDKPSLACLASRFAYGEKITKERLAAVEESEKMLHTLGFNQVRVRVHGNIARIEAEQKDIRRLTDMSERISPFLHSLGFTYVCIDIDGYRTGSMNQ